MLDTGIIGISVSAPSREIEGGDTLSRRSWGYGIYNTGAIADFYIVLAQQIYICPPQMLMGLMAKTTSRIIWKNSKRKISDLIPAPYNPRQLTEKQAKDLTKSIDKFDLCDPIVINANNTIIGGHQRINILKTKGVDEVDVRAPDRQLDEAEERELNVRLNKNLGEWNFDELANFDEDLLKDIGFDSKELDRIFQLDSPADADEIPETRETGIKAGCLYLLGRGYLMCGDSTNGAHVAALMQGNKADMVFTDPPYNVNYSGRGVETKTTIQNDNLTEDAFRTFLLNAFANYREYSKKNAALYCCYASRTHREFEDGLNANNWEVKNQIIWVKLVASMGWGDYRWKHEPLFYCHQKDQPVEFNGDRKQYTEWTEEKNDEELLKFIKSLIQKDENGNSTVWRFSRERDYKHPTQKPIELIKKALLNSSKRDDVVLDLFGGSGSTLIACELTNRRCFTMEIDPKFCQVIIDRWEKVTGKKSEKINAP